MQLIDKRLGTTLADGSSQFGRLAADLFLDCVKGSDPCDGFGSNRRGVGHMDIVELAPGMRPAGNFIDGAVAVEMMKSRIMWRAT